jgi:uncharacterized protein
MFAMATIAIASSTAYAAGFDCGKAKTVQEKAICASPSLSQADERLAERYRTAMNAVSTEGKARLRGDQRTWLAHLGKSCPADGLDTCLERAYRERLGSALAERRGPWLVQWIGGFAGRPLQPVIDAPENRRVADWNAMVAALAAQARTTADGETRVRFEMGLASERVISLRAVFTHRFTGAAATDTVAEGYTVLLAEGRQLRATDVFAADTDWVAELAPKVTQAIRAAAPQQGWPADVDAKDVAEELADPKAWLIDREEIDLAWGNAWNRPWSIRLSWEILRPYLVRLPAEHLWSP